MRRQLRSTTLPRCRKMRVSYGHTRALALTTTLFFLYRASCAFDLDHVDSLSCDFSARAPRRYAAFHLQGGDSLVIDGKLDERAWENVPFTEPFVDIEGARHWSQPWLRTRIKMRYDDLFLYVGAVLEETALWANETQRNAVVFHDNDFEVFIDADATTHNYKEVEVNARNASWNLWLNRPYRSGGHENSTRVDPTHGFDMYGKGFRSAVYTAQRRLNDPRERAHFWAVEMALPLAELARYTRASAPPKPKAMWRINFSRVEWQVRTRDDAQGKVWYEKVPGLKEANWVWSPQFAVDMHRPEHWGYVQFRARDEAPPLDASSIIVPEDPTWDARFFAFQLFYAQEAFKKAFGVYATAPDDALKSFVPIQAALACMFVLDMTVTPTQNAYVAHVHSRSQPDIVARITSESLVTVKTRSDRTRLFRDSVSELSMVE